MSSTKRSWAAGGACRRSLDIAWREEQEKQPCTAEAILQLSRDRKEFGGFASRAMIRIAGRRICLLARHGSGHRLLADEINHRANTWALRSLGVRRAVFITAVGSLRQELAPRHAVVPDQLVDRTGRAHEFMFFGNGIAETKELTVPL